MRVLKKVILVFIVGILIYVGLFLYDKYSNIVNNRNQLYVKSEEYNAVLRELRKEQDNLYSELNDLNEELYVGGFGSTIFLISDTHESCLDDAIKKLDKYGYKGVIALSYRYLPDDNHKGYLTRSQIDELVESGYEIVIKATNEDIDKTYEKFHSLGYDVKGFYFDDIVLNNLMVEQVHNIDENMVVIGNYLDGVDYANTILIHSYGSRQQNVNTYYEESVDKSEVVALTVGYDKSISRYEKKNFNNMINFVRDYIRYDQTEICNISGVIERYSIYQDKLESIEPEKYERVNEIRNRLDEISQEIMAMEIK